MAKKLFMAEISGSVTIPYIFYVEDKNIINNIDRVVMDNAHSIQEQMCEDILPTDTENVKLVTEKQALKSGISQKVLEWLKNGSIYGIDLDYDERKKLMKLLEKDYEKMKLKKIVG